MNYTDRWRWKGILSGWLRSYAIVIMIPVIIMAATHWQTRRVIENEIFKANSTLLSLLQQEIDNYVAFTYSLSDLVALNPKVNTLIRNQMQVGMDERLSIVQLLAEFKSYNYAKEYVKDFYIYFPNGDFVLSDSSYYLSDLYYQKNVRDLGISAENWRSFLTQAQRGSFFSLRELGGKTSDGIVFAKTLPVQQGSKFPATLVIRLNEEQLLATIRNLQTYNQGNVYILDAQNMLIASTEGEGAQNRQFMNPKGKGELLQSASAIWDGEEVVISYIESARSNWKYVYVLPASLYNEKADYVWNLTLLMLAVAMIAGLGTAVVLARKNYAPLRKLVHTVARRGGADSTNTSALNEYDYLVEAIDNTLDRYELINQMVEKQNLTLRSNLLVRLLKGRIENDFPFSDILPEYGIVLRSSLFAVVLFYLEDYSGFFRQDEQDEEKKREFVHHIMTNIVEEVVGRTHQGWMTEIDEMLACIVNFQPGTTPEGALDDLKSITEEVQRFLGNRFHIVFTISVSSVHSSVVDLHAAYQGALEAMEYRMVRGTQTIIWHNQITNQKPLYHYSMEKEQQLINYVNVGDYPAAKLILDEIINRNLAETNISVDMIRCLMFDMCSTMMKAAMESNLDRAELYEENLTAIRELMNGSTVSSMQDRMTHFLHKVCGYVDERKSSKKIRLKENVLAYVAENYRSHELSLSTIAEHFNVDPSYLSRYFKNHVGDNLSEYINKFRVEKSIALLQQEEIFIRDISDLVGFYSVSTYIRLFKKYKGVTPSVYREAKKQ